MNSDDRATIKSQKTTQSFTMLFLTIFIPFGLGHFISYLYRTVNAVIYNDLANELHLSADSLGLLTGIYFLTFAAAQLPVGVMLDRYGPRLVQTPMLLVAALGAVIFALSHSQTGLLIGRGLIGLGVAGSLMSAIKACSIWLPAKKLSLSTACLLSIGGLGALASTAPLHAALAVISWRQAFIGLAVLTVLISMVIYFFVRGSFVTKQTSFNAMCYEVGRLYRSWNFWRLGLYSVFAHATYMSILALWMGPWLRDVGNLNGSQTANALMYAAIAMVAGSLSFGWLTDYLLKYGVKPIMICGCGVTIFIFFQVLMLSGLPLSPYLVAIGFSFFGTAATMNYAIIAQSVEPSLSGRVSTSFNLIVFVLAFIVQWTMGLVISYWDVVAGHYPAIAYQWSLSLLIALQVPGLLLWLTFKPWRRQRVTG